MSFTAQMQYLGVDSTAVVTHQNAEVPTRIFYFYFDGVRLRVQECIYNGLATDAIHIIANHWA